jgi:hypothetical protein
MPLKKHQTLAAVKYIRMHLSDSRRKTDPEIREFYGLSTSRSVSMSAVFDDRSRDIGTNHASKSCELPSTFVKEDDDFVFVIEPRRLYTELDSYCSSETGTDTASEVSLDDSITVTQASFTI